jgi:hypothetical protein
VGTESYEIPLLEFQYLICGQALDPSPLGLLTLPITINAFYRQKNGGRETIFFENGEGMEEMILITIVKGYGERLPIELFPSPHMDNHLIERDHLAPMAK